MNLNKENNKKISVAIIIFCFLFFPPSVFAAVMSSNNYKIQSDSLSVGGTDNSSSLSYRLQDTLGQMGSGILSSLNELLKAGYRQAEEIIISAVAGNNGSVVTPANSAPPALTNVPPESAQSFVATPGDDGKSIDLKWQNPSEPNLNGVKIIRSESFYPEDPNTGIVIYQGKGESFIDQNLETGKRYFYTIFPYDKSGNIGSGATAEATAQRVLPEGTPVATPLPPEETPISTTTPIAREVQKFIIDQFDFYQDGKKISLENGNLKINVGKPLVISVDYGKVPEVLKTIMVTLKNSTGNTFSFLLRINKDKTAYQANVATPPMGAYSFFLTMMDYQHQALKRISGKMEIKATILGVSGISDNGIEDNNLIFNTVIFDILFLSILAIILIIIFFIARKEMAKIEKRKRIQEAIDYKP